MLSSDLLGVKLLCNYIWVYFICINEFLIEMVKQVVNNSQVFSTISANVIHICG